ncbi:MAG: hypothetical protein M3N56_08040, partial [Actinomycetota bacterium]|nr:hypothetical protein [Actinomycetota bacterium]
MIRAENLPTAERAKLAADGYLPDGFGEPEPSVITLTALGAVLATCALLALLSEEGEVAPNCYWIDGLFGDSREQEPQTPSTTAAVELNTAAAQDDLRARRPGGLRRLYRGLV